MYRRNQIGRKDLIRGLTSEVTIGPIHSTLSTSSDFAANRGPICPERINRIPDGSEASMLTCLAHEVGKFWQDDSRHGELHGRA
jgi:hypothetical protein